MNGKEIALILKEVEIQMEKIKAAELVVVNKHNQCFVGNSDWPIYHRATSSFTFTSPERAELDRTILSLQKNLGKLRKAMY